MFDKKVLVAGAGKSGICASEQLLRNGEQVVLFDENPKGTLTETVILEKLGFDKKPEALTIWLGALTDELLADISCMVISPGIPVDAPFALKVKEAGIPVWRNRACIYLREGYSSRHHRYERKDDNDYIGWRDHESLQRQNICRRKYRNPIHKSV